MAIIVGNTTSNTTITNTAVKLYTAASAPSNPILGQIYYDTTALGIFVYNGSSWIGVDTTPGLSSSYPVTSFSVFEAKSPTAGTYWIKPTGASTAFQCEYSGTNYRSTGYGFFRWWRAVDQSTPTVNFYGNGYQWNLMAVEKESSSIYTIGFSSNQTFDLRSDTSTATSGTRSGYQIGRAHV